MFKNFIYYALALLLTLPMMGSVSAANGTLLVVGDSIDWGYDGGSPGVPPGTQTGWATSYAGALNLDVNMLAVPGYTALEVNVLELPDALKMIAANPGNHWVVTYGAGGNEVLRLITTKAFYQLCMADPARLTKSCLHRINALISQLATYNDRAVKMLRDAVGPNGTILVRTYPVATFASQCSSIPFPGADALAYLVFEGTEGFGGAVSGINLPGDVMVDGLNDNLRQVAAKYNATLVDIFPYFTPANPYLNSMVGEDCLHPNILGYQFITNAFLQSYP